MRKLHVRECIKKNTGKYATLNTETQTTKATSLSPLMTLSQEVKCVVYSSASKEPKR